MVKDSDQAHAAFDDSPDRFRDRNPSDQFSGASGVLFEQAMAQTRMAICLSDPNQKDQPIVFANRAFRELTGYSDDEILGRNCRFLQGPETDQTEVAKIRQALRDENVVVVELLNYRRDGTKFWNALHLGPIYDDQGKLIYYFGSQWDVTDVHAARSDEAHARAMSRELSHRMKNMFSVIGAIVTVTGRSRGIREHTSEINDRIQALGRAYEPTLDEASLGDIEVGQAIRSVLGPYDADRERIRFLGNGVRVDPNIVSTIGLTLHELATNALKYGALKGEEGRIDVNWIVRDGDDGLVYLVICWDEYCQHEITPPTADQGTGLGIIDILLGGTDGSLERSWQSDGVKAEIRIPFRRHRDRV